MRVSIKSRQIHSKSRILLLMKQRFVWIKSILRSNFNSNQLMHINQSFERRSFTDSHLSIATFKISSKRVKNTCVQICKHCKQNFNFNNKFHDHIREHYARTFVKSSDFRVFALESAYKLVEKLAITCSFTSQFASFIFFATSRNQIFEFEIFLKTIISSKRSNFTFATNKNTSKSMKKLSINCSFIFSFSSFQISVRNFHEFHIQKSHFIMNDFSRMFVEKSNSFDLQRYQNRRFSSQSFNFRQFSRMCFSISTKSYFIIENLFEMFDEKIKKRVYFKVKRTFFFENFSQNNRELQFISSLQTIKSRRLIKI